MTYIWIAAGSALGGAFRYWCSGVAARLIGETFPWGTLLINILGSFVIGVFFTLTGPDGRLLVSPNIRQFVMVGLCGGYTTFSSFSLQTLNLIRDGEILTACQQACPAEALTFGNINDKTSKVAQYKQEPRNYALLSDLGTQPRTTYLAGLRNPNPELEAKV